MIWRFRTEAPGRSTPRSRLHRRCGIFVALLFAGLAGLGPANRVCAQTVYTEPKSKLIPGGAGQKPFDVTRHTIPISAIQAGGPARDEIPALVRPGFISAREMGRQLKDSDRVLGVFLNGEAKAYPVQILNWHELVNDEVGDSPALVSW